jgi:pimeloyl-ACP methyl ester carboxylesterase
MDGFERKTLAANNGTIEYVEMGDGPLVVFCHGFPESWYSWRHQLPAVADAGYRAVALSMRGYGNTTSPDDIDRYTAMDIIGDVVGATNALGAGSAVVVGHDWGAPIAWWAALVRPDLFRAVAAMSVPLLPPVGSLPDGLSVTALMQMAAGDDRDYYRLYFGEPGKAEPELEADVDRSVRGFMYTISGDAVAAGHGPFDGHFPAGERFVDQLVVPDELPAWLTEDDVAFYVGELERTGFRGGLNWYRNMDRIPGALAPWLGAKIRQPACYIGGTTDLIAGNTAEGLAAMRSGLADLRVELMIEGAGHWIQQERPAEVNTALTGFLDGL